MSASTLTSLTIRLASPEATYDFGKQLGATLAAGQVVALSGDLGAGKTTLTQGIAAGMGIKSRVTSPTFTLINQYQPGERRLLLVHIDTYRLGGDDTVAAQAEAADLGLSEIMSDAAFADDHADGAIVVIEWAERIANLLPPDTLYIELTPVPDDANARFATLTTASIEVADRLKSLSPDTQN
jgi:tRNA threonylcarbamoyladenosine biosynthesis protein TsaE